MNAELYDLLLAKIKILNETTWEGRANKSSIDAWLQNFGEEEKILFLFLLSNFMYFGSIQMRTLLKAMYRDLYKYRIVEKIRKANADTTDYSIISKEFEKEQRLTRFLGIGNPSESGPHLLYFFRQENKISKKLFINPHEIYGAASDGKLCLKDPAIKEYVFIDDFCGSGKQAVSYSKNILKNVKALNPKVSTSYLMLFGTKKGKDKIKSSTLFDHVESVFEFDESFKCFTNNSRVFRNAPAGIDQKEVERLSYRYGKKLMKSICTLDGSPDVDDCAEKNAHGFGDGQLLVGFHHNTPDNTLPVFWYDEEEVVWAAIFRRYNKKYGL